MWINNRLITKKESGSAIVPCREPLLDSLDLAVKEAIAFFGTLDDASGRNRRAHDVLAHLLFWHREYLLVARGIAAGHYPALLVGTNARLNAAAAEEFASLPFAVLARQLEVTQSRLDGMLRALPDWNASFPSKQGGRYVTVEQRVEQIAGHFREHVAQLRQVSPTGRIAARSRALSQAM